MASPLGNSPPPAVYVRIAGEVRGPIRFDVLRELFEVGAVIMTSEIAESADGPWTDLQSKPWSGQVPRDRPELGFAPTRFEVTNDNAAPLVDVRGLITAATGSLAHLKGDGARVSPPHAPEKSAEIVAMVREVADREAQVIAAPPLKLSRRPNKRLGHYLLLLATGNGFIVALPWIYDAPVDEFVLLTLVGWAAVYNLALAYAMFLILPRY